MCEHHVVATEGNECDIWDDHMPLQNKLIFQIDYTYGLVLEFINEDGTPYSKRVICTRSGLKKIKKVIDKSLKLTDPRYDADYSY